MLLVAQVGATLLRKVVTAVVGNKKPRRAAASTSSQKRFALIHAGLLSWKTEADAGGSNHQWLEISNQE